MTRVTTGTMGPAVEVHDRPEHLSYSQLVKLHPFYSLACPRQWGYRYRLKLPDEPSAPLLVGRAFDEAANCYFGLRLQGIKPLKAGALAMDVGLPGLQEDAAEHPDVFGDKLSDYQSLFMSAFAAFLNSEGSADVARVQDRHTFVLGIGPDRQIPVIGFSDRIDRDGTVCDHKYSGSPRWDKEGIWHQDWLIEKRDQLLIYWLARNAEEARTGKPLDPPLNGRGRLVVTYHKLGLIKAQVHVHEMELSLREGGAEVLERLAQAGLTAQEGRYPARPGQACRYCSFLGRCRDDELVRGRPFFDLVEIPF